MGGNDHSQWCRVMRRFFIHEKISPIFNLSPEDSYHIAKVLRMKVGTELVVVDKDEAIAVVKIIAIENNLVTVAFQGYLEDNTEAPINLILAQGLPKADKMDFIVQKAVELGVTEIQPLIMENCVVKYDEAKKSQRQTKWQKIANEAAKQCGRTVIPEIKPIITLGEFLKSLPKSCNKIVCYEAENNNGIKKLLDNTNSVDYCVFVGPEGGFSNNEIKICNENYCQPVTLGPHILRTETASLAAISIILYHKGDLGGF